MSERRDTARCPAGDRQSEQDSRFEAARTEFGGALGRLASVYERDPDKRRDLLQEILFALWRSFSAFDGRCSIRTWVYRVAHNVATSHVLRRRNPKLASLDTLASMSSGEDAEGAIGRQLALARLLELVQGLIPTDRQVILLYLEGLEATAIGEITGLSGRNVSTKVHRIKQVLSRQFHQGVGHGA